MELKLIHPPVSGVVNGEIILNGSKSIANRALIIRALSGVDFEIDNLSLADDTAILDQLVKSSNNVLDAGAGGTTFRFLTAFLATQEGREVVLTGSERMQQRPIRILVDALNALGADISYVNNEGFPPLRIRGKKLKGGNISIPADTSSQYISALLMIGPLLSGGLQLTLQGEVVSLPYIRMTLNLMQFFGASCNLEGNLITVQQGKYSPAAFFVEADWSAASYYYTLAALASEADITLHGLSEESVQGDAVIANIMAQLGVNTTYQNRTVRLEKIKDFVLPEVFEYDFLECPDLAQTVVAYCGAVKIPMVCNGLKTLRIKETDRIAALDAELSPLGVHFKETGVDEWKLTVQSPEISNSLKVKTYEDHRMAMAFAPLSLKLEQVIIEEPHVVTKSYPAFWNDLETLGFRFS